MVTQRLPWSSRMRTWFSPKWMADPIWPGASLPPSAVNSTAVRLSLPHLPVAFLIYFIEHLGLIRPQICGGPNDPVTPFMRAAPVPNEDEFEDEASGLVADPLSDDVLELWVSTARENRAIFTEIFKPVPTNLVRTWDAYKVRVFAFARPLSLDAARHRPASTGDACRPRTSFPHYYERSADYVGMDRIMFQKSRRATLYRVLHSNKSRTVSRACAARSSRHLL